jgi:hypothetical protein
MYQKPRVERFGTFRELTSQDWQVLAIDGVFVCGEDSINTPGNPDNRS